jgi:hypothetical protein
MKWLRSVSPACYDSASETEFCRYWEYDGKHKFAELLLIYTFVERVSERVAHLSDGDCGQNSQKPLNRNGSNEHIGHGCITVGYEKHQAVVATKDALVLD